MWGWGIAAALGALLLVPAVAMAKTHSRPPVRRSAIEDEAGVWGPVFGVPIDTLMVISKIESGWKPDTVNYDIRAEPLGYAWGPLQMTVKTANDWAARLLKSSNVKVRSVASRWHGDGNDLIRDLELAVLLSAAMLGALTKEFKTLPLVAAAYHQGAGKIRQMLAAG